MIISASGDIKLSRIGPDVDSMGPRHQRVHKLNITPDMIPVGVFIAINNDFYTIALNEFRITAKNVTIIEKVFEILLGDLKAGTLEEILPEIQL